MKGKSTLKDFKDSFKKKILYLWSLVTLHQLTRKLQVDII